MTYTPGNLETNSIEDAHRVLRMRFPNRRELKLCNPTPSSEPIAPSRARAPTPLLNVHKASRGYVRSRSRVFLPVFRFIKKTYVWLVWIPFLLTGLGTGMNFLAVTMNHGIMPVVLPAWGAIADTDKVHVPATANSRLLFLCDWIQVYATADVASPGDYLIRAGEVLKWPLVWIWTGLTCGQLNWRKLAAFTEACG